MKLLSRIAFICNVSFVLFIILQYVEFNNRKNKVNDNIIPLPFITGTLVILGQLAVFINLVFCLAVVISKLAKKELPAPVWLVWTNMAFFLLQLFYFFIY